MTSSGSSNSSGALAPAQSAAQAAPTPWVWRAQAVLMAYLPLLMMALFAGGTWWLVKNTPMADGPTVAVAPRHVPDYLMTGFELQRMGRDGKLRARIEGAELRHYPDTDTVEIDGVRLRAVSEDGSLTLASARRAVSNADGSDMQLFGDVQLQRFTVNANGQPSASAKLQVRGEFLQALANSEKLRSHLPVTINYAGGEMRSQGFEYDHLRGVVSFTGRTTGRFEMPRSRK